MKSSYGRLGGLLFLSLLLPGCGSDVCVSLRVITVSPATATADHNAAPPRNSKQFFAFPGGAGPGCVTTQGSLPNVAWSVSDPVNASISNTPDATFGTATCTGAVSGAVTVTATLPANADQVTAVSGTAALTCN